MLVYPISLNKKTRQTKQARANNPRSSIASTALAICSTHYSLIAGKVRDDAGGSSVHGMAIEEVLSWEESPGGKFEVLSSGF